jgi:membrane-associated phospholipid phosphatase
VPRNVRAPLAGCLACIGGLVAVTLLVYGSGAVQRLDRTVRDWLLAEPGSKVESLASAVHHLGDPLALLSLTAVACGIGLVRGRRREVAAALAVVVGANLTTQLLKVLVSHPRFRSILGAEGFSWDGFPSGHTTAMASVTIAFAFVVPTALRPLVAGLGAGLTIAVGVSMVVLHRHFPSDIVGGFLVAGAWGCAALAALRATRSSGLRQIRQPASRAAISVK